MVNRCAAKSWQANALTSPLLRNLDFDLNIGSLLAFTGKLQHGASQQTACESPYQIVKPPCMSSSASASDADASSYSENSESIESTMAFSVERLPDIVGLGVAINGVVDPLKDLLGVLLMSVDSICILRRTRSASMVCK
jgi:hypothetical protein